MRRSSLRFVVAWLPTIALLAPSPLAQSPGAGAALAAYPRPASSQQAMVSSAHPDATVAGLEILRSGGNAVDAAIATTLAISVVEPFSAGIGGGGFALVHEAKTGRLRALDFRERAPLAASRDMFLDGQKKPIPRASTIGHRAVAVPGTIAGLAELHRQGGKLSWSRLVEPAIRLADRGVTIGWRYAEFAEQLQPILNANAAMRSAFTRQGQPYRVGDRLRQPDLAQTLRRIAADPQDFYQGEIAGAIVADMAAQGGLIGAADLLQYRPIWREPVCGAFRQYRVCSMPPPSSGGIHLLQILNLIGDRDLRGQGWHHPDSLHFLAEAMKIAYADRAVHLGDPAFVTVPTAALLSEAYAKLRRAEITDRARPAQAVKAGVFGAVEPTTRPAPQGLPTASPNPPATGREGSNTSHLNVVDRDRNAVSLTFTINGPFGAAVVAPNTGILLNNEMDDFAIAPDTPNLFGLVGSDANAIAPGKTPLSSMTPTIVTEQPATPRERSLSPGESRPELRPELRLVLGSPGGSTIITTALQVLLNSLVYEMDLGSAIAAPRIHHQWQPDRLRIEPFGLDILTEKNLRDRGHTLDPKPGWGNANAIRILPNNQLQGAADPRGEGNAQGF
jgi:gamma-glutamyltranspeptidase / glutathione hydrolase